MKLLNNFTTPEQSKRLMTLGVPADSADMYYQNALPEPKVIPSQRRYSEHINKVGIGAINRELWHFSPCWSLGRLIEIELGSREKKRGMVARLEFILTEREGESELGSTIEALIYLIEDSDYKYDFSQLEL